MSLKRYNTEKLFYNTFYYKLTLSTPLAYLFREKKFHFARESLANMQEFYDNKQPIKMHRGRLFKTISDTEFLEAKQILKELELGVDFRIRIDLNRMHLYSNDLSWLETLSNFVSGKKYLFELNKDYSNLIGKNVIVKNKPWDYKYKLYLKDTVDPSLARWLENNKDKSKVGTILLQRIKLKQYVKNMYFYVRDDRILQLVTLMVGNSIQRIDKIVSMEDLDK